MEQVWVKIENTRLHCKIDHDMLWIEQVARAFDGLEDDTYPLRYSLTSIQDEVATIEATTVVCPTQELARALSDDLHAINKKTHQSERFGIVQIIPTGIRCEYGGYAGDATAVTNLLAEAVDFVVTHPNAVNASDINEKASNILYVEGKSLDEFVLGRLALRRTVRNSIGTFIDPTGLEQLDSIIHTLNAGRAVAGFDCGRHTLLKSPLGVKIEWSDSGSASGTILNPDGIIEGVRSLIDEGATAIGGVSVIHGVTKDMSIAHMQGKIPNPSGVVEAIITHLISKVFKVPTAHAPLPYYLDVKHPTTDNPRASAEFISTPHYFSVLKGLHDAPHLIPLGNLNDVPADLISINDIGAIVMPASTLGGIPALASEFSEIPLIAVRENATVLNMTNAVMQMRQVIEVNSYLEAAGVILALKRGINLDALKRPINVTRARTL